MQDQVIGSLPENRIRNQGVGNILFPGRPPLAVLCWIQVWTAVWVLGACGGEDDGAIARDAAVDGLADRGSALDARADAAGPWDAAPDAALDAGVAPCPEDMVQMSENTCMDRYEAPNREGALPLVMYSFDEAASWCAYRGKRLCYDDEWTLACAGPGGNSYPYGDQYQAGVCNDDKQWRTYNQDLLNLWPWSLDTDTVESLDQLLDRVRAVSSDAAQAADHVESLYQADPSGSHAGCVGGAGVFDLEGNVEEWTRRRDGGEDQFHGNLKGRYWAEPRTCQSNVTVHGDAFRFYEIGFRCCRDVTQPH